MGVKVAISGKDYKAKKSEYEYIEASKLFIFKGDNLAGSWAVKRGIIILGIFCACL